MNSIIKQYEEAANELATAFILKYHPETTSNYWIGDDIGGNG